MAIYIMNAFKKIQKLEIEQERLLDKIKIAILKVPTNPKVKELGHNCFALRSSEIMKHRNWTPTYYSFELSSKLIVEILESCGPRDAGGMLNNIINDGYAWSSGKKQNLHPDFINHLKKIYES
jgi:hypothetical protein